MCPDARILEEILEWKRAEGYGWMGQTWFTSNILEPLIIFGFCSESNPFVDAFPRNFFRRSKVNKPKQSMRTLPHLSLPCLSYWRPADLLLESTCNRQSRCVIGFSSPSRSSPLLSGQDDPETAQWHVDLYIKKAFVKDVSAPALF